MSNIKATEPANCLVDGETVMEGNYFVPKDMPNLSCYCKPGYTGKYIFNKKRNSFLRLYKIGWSSEKRKLPNS